jgi:hypothetical protein
LEARYDHPLSSGSPPTPWPSVVICLPYLNDRGVSVRKVGFSRFTQKKNYYHHPATLISARQRAKARYCDDLHDSFVVNGQVTGLDASLSILCHLVKARMTGRHNGIGLNIKIACWRSLKKGGRAKGGIGGPRFARQRDTDIS